MSVANSLFVVPFLVKVAVAVWLVVAYVVHVVRTVIAGGGPGGGAGRPHLLARIPFRGGADLGRRRSDPGVARGNGVGAHYFVKAVKSGSESLGIPTGLISLVLAPLATELPEKFNSVIWLRDNKDTPAIGNITGAMVFQSTIPVSLGLVYTFVEPLDSLNALSAGLALLGGAGITAMLLSAGGLPVGRPPVRRVPGCGDLPTRLVRGPVLWVYSHRPDDVRRQCRHHCICRAAAPQGDTRQQRSSWVHRSFAPAPLFAAVVHLLAPGPLLQA